MRLGTDISSTDVATFTEQERSERGGGKARNKVQEEDDVNLDTQVATLEKPRFGLWRGAIIAVAGVAIAMSQAVMAEARYEGLSPPQQERALPAETPSTGPRMVGPSHCP